jgi:hypothetical protein
MSAGPKQIDAGR